MIIDNNGHEVQLGSWVLYYGDKYGLQFGRVVKTVSKLSYDNAVVTSLIIKVSRVERGRGNAIVRRTSVRNTNRLMVVEGSAVPPAISTALNRGY